MEINETILKLVAEEKELQKQLTYWEQYEAVNNMGKWARQTKIDRISEKLKKVQEKIHFHNTLYLSNEIYKEWKKDVQ